METDNTYFANNNTTGTHYFEVRKGKKPHIISPETANNALGAS